MGIMRLQSLRTPLLVGAAGFLLAGLSLGIRHTFGLYLKPMSETMGWGREVFSLAIAIQTLLWGFLQPVTGGWRIVMARAGFWPRGECSMRSDWC